jgi:hypothetical protein
MLLISLGLSEGEYVDIEHKHPRSLKNILTDGLLLWKSKVGQDATTSSLMDNLKRGSHNRAAGNIGCGHNLKNIAIT